MNNTDFSTDLNAQGNDGFNPNKSENQNSIFNIRVKAGSRRTYFFDVKTNKTKDYYIIITERRKKFDDDKAFDKNKIFLYKEDFNKFVKGLTDAVDYVKTELMPDFDFSVFDRERKPFDGQESTQELTQENAEFTPTKTSNFEGQYDENDRL